MTFESSTLILGEPWALIDFLSNLDEGTRYRDWCPHDHISIQRLKVNDSVFRFVERIGNRRIALRFRIARRGKMCLEFYPTGIAGYLRLGHARYEFVPEGGKWRMISTLRIGTSRSWDRCCVRLVVDPLDLAAHLAHEERFLSRYSRTPT
jgi:hypothetical protein